MPITDVVNTPGADSEAEAAKENTLGSWCLEHMETWEDTRNTNYEVKWARYERLWRGLWSSNDQQRSSERSKLISPALSAAIESIVAEIEEAIFASGRFFDIDPDTREEDKEQMTILRDLLYNDMLVADVKSSISEIVLNGAIYGTGIGKIVIETTENKHITPKPVNGLAEVVEAGVTGEEEVVVRLVSVHPYEFVTDDAAKNLNDAMGSGHVTIVPLHIVKKRQQLGIYDPEVMVEPYNADIKINPAEDISRTSTNRAKIYEYQGLVPVELLAKHVLGEDYDSVVDVTEMDDEEEMTEAIVTVDNGGQLLRAVPNPNTMQDRNFIAFQFDTMPNQFYGRGVAEKGLNAQMALDGELRGRQDGMALAIHPMMAADASMMPPGSNLKVRPGRSVLTNGNPRDILMPLNFGQIGTDTFTQSADLERQVAKATGALDDANMSPNHAKTGAMGIAVSGAIKRSQRTLANVERNIIDPLVHKFAWRYMQYAPDKYPIVNNPKFKVQTTQGIMAKELEQMQLGNMLKTVAPESPAYWMLIKGVFQNSSIKNREVYDGIIDQELQKAMNPQPSPAEQAQMAAQDAKLKIDMARARAELLRIELEAQKLETGNLKTHTEAMLNVAKAEAEEAGVQVGKYNAILGRIQAGLDMNLKKKDAQDMAAQAGAVPPQ